MSKGYLVFAQNSKVDYVRQAVALAASLRISGNTEPISIVTNDIVPSEYRSFFDQIIEIPWGDSSKHSEWKVENRWKLYHVSPYDETIVLDSDILVTESLTNAWNFLINYDLFFTSTVYNYRSNSVIDTANRRAFVENQLPNVYVGFHYFKKSDLAKLFYQQLEDVVKNHQLYYSVFVSKNTQEFVSLDVSAAVAVKVLGIESEVTCAQIQPTKFIHMKTNLQSLGNAIDRWSKVLSVDYSDRLIVGNFVQRGVFHYVDKEFLTEEIFNKLCQHAADLVQ